MQKLIIAVILCIQALHVVTAGPVDVANLKRPIRLACVGDSITQGAGTRGNPYPKQLQEMLGDSWEVRNFGVSGRTLLKKGDHPYWKEKAYRSALDYKPDVVIIKLGTNDTKPQNFAHQAEFENDLRDLAKSFLELESKPRVFLCRPVPVVGNGNFNITEENLQQYMPKIESVAKELDLDIIDMHAALADKPQLIPDRVHPNAAGAGVMARTAYAALTGKTAPTGSVVDKP